VEPGSAAERAGLRNGMAYLGRVSGVFGDSRVAYRVRVRDGANERVISYQPAGAASITFQELEPVGGLSSAQRSACERVAGGG
jgi:predicted metalloprotease with PDZ domain